jgi:RNA polymerase sigma factor (sigma-70 family)
MATGQLRAVVRHLRRTPLVPDGGGLTDRHLLEQFLARRDEAAFEALVRRHGPMVLGVCRRVVRNLHDAEDAFQATFLILARKANTIHCLDSVASWLHGTAFRAALATQTAPWRRREKQVKAMPEPEAVAAAEIWSELRPVLDQELERLPDKYRAAIVLCDLEGKRRKEAARQLGVAEGTLSGRLTKARRLLAARLARRGVSLAVALPAILAPGTASAHVTKSLVLATVKAVTAGFVSGPVAAITEGVMKGMSLSTIKRAIVVLMAAFVIVTVAAHRPLALALAKEGSPPVKGAAVVIHGKPQGKKDQPGWHESFVLKHEHAVNILACSADWIAAGDEGGNLSLCDARTGKNKKVWLQGGKEEGLTSSVDRLQFTPDGKRLFGITQEHRAIWMFKIDKPDDPSPGLKGENPTYKGFSADGQTWLEAYGRTLVLRPNPWTRGAVVDYEQIQYDAEPLHALLSSDDKWLAIVTADQHLRIHDRAALRETQSIDLAKQTVIALCFSPDGKRLAVVGQNSLATVYDTDSGKEIAVLKGHSGIVFAVAFSPDSKSVVTGGDDNVARVWEVATAKMLAVLEGHKDSVRAVAFDPSGDMLITGSADKTVKAWKVQR